MGGTPLERGCLPREGEAGVFWWWPEVLMCVKSATVGSKIPPVLDVDEML